MRGRNTWREDITALDEGRRALVDADLARPYCEEAMRRETIRAFDENIVVEEQKKMKINSSFLLYAP
jgi:hypothetical protein